MAKDETSNGGGKPKITLPDGKEVSIRKARSVMETLSEEAAMLREDDSPAASSPSPVPQCLLKPATWRCLRSV